VKSIVAWVAVLGGQGALAEEQEQTEWQTPQEVLAAINPGKAPDKPKIWHSPRGPVVLHGDLFGDGRHLALVGGEGTSWAFAKDGAWVVAGGLDVVPAWVPPGKTTTDERYIQYYNCNPPEVPFVLKDLNGDRVPEVLVAFNNDGYRTGYAIARKEGQDIELMDLRSERGEPEWTGDYLVVTTRDPGRKDWGSGDTYYKWREGVPVPMATWNDYARDPEIIRNVAERHQAGGKDRDFELVQNDDGSWNVRSRDWKGAGKTAAWKDFARIQLTVDPAHELDPDVWRAEEALLFELTTGISGEALRVSLPKGESFDFAKAASRVRVQVEGSDEAKETLKRISK
jgi:hypothetical protein